MRLKNIYFLCKELLPIIDGITYEKEEISKTPKAYKCIYKGWGENLSQISRLGSITCLQAYIDEIRMFSLENMDSYNNYSLLSRESNELMAKIKELNIRVKTIIDICESLGYSPDENGFDVRLPDNMDLNDFAECVKDINTAFSQNPYLNQDGSKVEFKALDIGSNWIVFTAICAGATKLLDKLAVIVDKVVMIRSHILTCKYQEQQLKDMGAKSDLVDNMIQVHKQTTSLLYENVAKDLETSLGKLEDGEQQERLRVSLDLLSKWMEKGMEIYSSIDAPDEIKALFPPVEKQKLSKIDIKRLTKKSESENNE